jgi:hypothetical protein
MLQPQSLYLYFYENIFMEIRQRKLVSALCHGAIFLSSTIASIVIPLIVLIAAADPIVRTNAKESINFHISLFVYAIATIILGFLGLMLFSLFTEDPPFTPNLPSDVALPIYLLSLSMMAIAALLFILLSVASLLLPIFAIVRVAKRPDQPFRYPLIFRLL